MISLHMMKLPKTAHGHKHKHRIAKRAYITDLTGIAGSIESRRVLKCLKLDSLETNI